MRRAQRRSGFTLLELIVVIGLMGVVSTMGAVMFSKMLGTWTGLKSHTDLDRRAQWVLEDIGKDVAAMISPSLAPDAHLVGLKPEGADSHLLVLPVALPGMGGRTVGGFATYHVFEPDEETVEDTLVREIQMIDDEFADAQRVTVAKGVKAFGVKFAAKDGQWVDKWDENDEGLPNAIRISLTMADPDNPYRDRVTRMAVFPILVD